MSSVPLHHHSHCFGGIHPLLEEVDEFDVADVELIQSLRETGRLLHGDALGSGERHVGSWYNPAPMQRIREQARKDDELRRRAEKKEMVAQLRLRAEAAVTLEKVKERYARQREIDAEKARQATLAMATAHHDDAEHERQNAEARGRAALEQQCWDIAQEAAAHWQCSETEARLMWNMMRYQNLGAGRGKEWNEGAFAAAVMVPDEIVRRCYRMLRDR